MKKYKIGDEIKLFRKNRYEIVDIRGFWIFKKYKVRVKSNTPGFKHPSHWIHGKNLKWYKSGD